MTKEHRDAVDRFCTDLGFQKCGAVAHMRSMGAVGVGIVPDGWKEEASGHTVFLEVTDSCGMNGKAYRYAQLFRLVDDSGSDPDFSVLEYHCKTGGTTLFEGWELYLSNMQKRVGLLPNFPTGPE